MIRQEAEGGALLANALLKCMTDGEPPCHSVLMIDRVCTATTLKTCIASENMHGCSGLLGIAL